MEVVCIVGETVKGEGDAMLSDCNSAPIHHTMNIDAMAHVLAILRYIHLRHQLPWSFK